MAKAKLRTVNHNLFQRHERFGSSAGAKVKQFYSPLCCCGNGCFCNATERLKWISKCGALSFSPGGLG